MHLFQHQRDKRTFDVVSDACNSSFKTDFEKRRGLFIYNDLHLKNFAILKRPTLRLKKVPTRCILWPSFYILKLGPFGAQWLKITPKAHEMYEKSKKNFWKHSGLSSKWNCIKHLFNGTKKNDYFFNGKGKGHKVAKGYEFPIFMLERDKSLFNLEAVPHKFWIMRCERLEVKARAATMTQVFWYSQ